MLARQYLLVSGVVFALVALAHVVRVIYALPVTVDSYSLPMWVSYLGTLVPAFLAFSAFRLAFRAD